MLDSFKRMAEHTPGVGTVYTKLRRIRHRLSEPDFYSPLPSLKEARRREQTIWGEPSRVLPAVDLNEVEQLSLYDELKNFYAELPFEDEPRSGLRYYFHNEWFGDADAILLYSMIRHLKPKRIIEIGSGFSSAVTLDTNDLFFGGDISCTFIEPNAERLLSLLNGRDREKHTILEKEVQDVELALFGTLRPNDILFIDSSHVTKVYSDVNWLFFRVLPALARGVFVHFHDVFYPFEYPKEWLFLDRRGWNEAYLLRAFLQYNSAFQIKFFNAYMVRYFRDRFRRDMPRWVQDPPGSPWASSIWLQKV